MKDSLTTAALDELDTLDPAARAEIEALLASDPGAAALAAETREFCDTLSSTLAPPDVALTDEQRAALVAELTAASREKKIVRGFNFRHVALLGAATSVAALAVVQLRRQQNELSPKGTLAASTPAPATPLPPSQPSKLALSQPHFSTEAPPASGPVDALAANDLQSLSKMDGTTRLNILSDEAAPAARPLSANKPVTGVTLAASTPPIRTESLESLSTAVPGQAGADGFDKSRGLGLVGTGGTGGTGGGGGGYAGGGLAANRAKAIPAERGGRELAQAEYRYLETKTAAPAAPAAPASATSSDFKVAETTRGYAFGLGTTQDALGDDLEQANGLRSRTSAQNEAYTAPPENAFVDVRTAPLSTFSIDVDTASYANVRRFLNQGQRPPKAAVRLEELVNYFSYDYAPPAAEDKKPFAAHVEIADAPWAPTHRLVRFGLKGRDLAPGQRPAGNFVFLIDVSGSMNEPDKLPLVQKSLRLLVERLNADDHVSLVTYAGQSGLALDSTSGDKKSAILHAIDALGAGGSTNGAGGITSAYQQAVDHFIKGGVNRVILATDGDFNVGLSSDDEMKNLITEKAKTGVFLSVLGFGTGNLKDSKMETLADAGNGNYAYIDSLGEARKVLAGQMNSTLVTIARDMKVQIEFNPARVQSYRLLGYENRLLAKEDFNNDKKDAGEIGAGHTITALYEVIPAGATGPDDRPTTDPLKYAAAIPAPAPLPADAPASTELLTLKLRAKPLDSDVSELTEIPVKDEGKTIDAASADFRWAASVAGFGLLLKDSQHKGSLTWEKVRALALPAKGPDPEGYRGEFLQLIDKARGL